MTYSRRTDWKGATHLIKLPQRPCLALWKPLSQEMGRNTTKRVEGRNTAEDGAGRGGLVAGGCGDGTTYVDVGASHYEILAMRRWLRLQQVLHQLRKACRPPGNAWGSRCERPYVGSEGHGKAGAPD